MKFKKALALVGKVIAFPFVKGADLVCWPFEKAYAKLKKYRIFHSEMFQILFLSFFTTVVIEILSKRSFLKMVRWMVKSPAIFLVNWMIVLIPYSIGLFLKRRYLVYAITTFCWVLIGIIDAVVISTRVTPFTANDIKVLPTVFSVIEIYITGWKKYLILVGVLFAVVIFVAFSRLPVREDKIKRPIRVLGGITMAGTALAFVIISMKIGLIETRFVNLRNAYQDNGLAYCFMNSVFNIGISKPKGYSQSQVENLIDRIDVPDYATMAVSEPDNVNPDVATPTKPDEYSSSSIEKIISEFQVNVIPEDERPNIIFIQLESFFDVNRLVDVTDDPIPTMTSLYKKYHSGLLGVPCIGAGTANTEFEVLTGMNMDDFGPGEIPYRTAMSKKKCESIAYNLKENGYSTHAIHNNVADFYGRNIVYPNLGIDNFTSVEFMTNVRMTSINSWAKDEVLIKYIESCLDSTPNQDLVFTVSVQGHGPYPDFSYYVEQINEMDKFVSDLITKLKKRKENTVLVLYGDHLPGFDFDEEDLKEGDLYQTEYVIWSNFNIGKPVRKNIEANELSAYVMQLLGYNSGLISKLHMSKSQFNEPDYWESLRVLEYDMLYGDQYCWGGECPYESSDLVYGHRPVTIKAVDIITDPDDHDVNYLTIEGENFNVYSYVYVNGKKQKSIYVSENKLFVPNVDVSEGSEIVIWQGREQLASSNTYVVPEEE